MPERAFPSGVYAITPECTDTDLLLRKVESALKGGVAAVQYRDKTADVALRHEQASELLELCRDHAVPLIINDDLRLADLVSADGVHLGKEDSSLREARLILGPEKLVGISCYQNPDLALTAQAGGADYVAFGSFYPSITKPQASPASIEILHHAAASVWVPIVAIGGINVDNARPLIDAGADSIAVISALFDAPDIEMAAKALNDLFIAETEN
jgi:thiamine-phosphate pyrophosphorylase